jgi:hypothetical protein
VVSTVNLSTCAILTAILSEVSKANAVAPVKRRGTSRRVCELRQGISSRIASPAGTDFLSARGGPLLTAYGN